MSGHPERDEEKKPDKPIGRRSTFDWVFMVGALASAFAIAGYLKDIRSDIHDKLSASDFSLYTLRLNRAAKGTFEVPIWLPQPDADRSWLDEQQRPEGGKK
jgi:hypothetical protein